MKLYYKKVLYCNRGGWLGGEMGHNTILYHDLGRAGSWALYHNTP